MLEDIGFVNINMDIKRESASYIKDWLPGSNAEDYVVSANISAFKPFPLMKSTSQKQPRQIERLNFKIQPVTTNASSKDSCCKVQKNGEKNNK